MSTASAWRNVTRPWEAGAARMALEHRLKAVMDPKLLFNPGKVLGP